MSDTTSWLKNHQTLVLAVLIIGSVLFLGSKWIDRAAEQAHDAAVVAQQAATAQAEATKAITAQVAALTSQWQADRLAQQQAIATLSGAIAARNQASQKQIAAVTAPKTAVEAVNDLSTAYNLPATISATETGALVPTVDLQVFTVTKIERDAAIADLHDTESQLKLTRDGLTQTTGLVEGLQTQVGSLNAEIKLNKTAYDAEIKAAKISTLKSKRNWFVAGFVAGFASAVAILR